MFDDDDDRVGVSLRKPADEEPRSAAVFRFLWVSFGLIVILVGIGGVGWLAYDLWIAEDVEVADVAVPTTGDLEVAGTTPAAAPVGSPSAAADDRSAATRTFKGERDGRRLVIKLPDPARQWGRISLRAEGHTGSVSSAVGGVTAAVWLVGDGANCPQRIPEDQTSERAPAQLLSTEVRGEGSFRSAANRHAPEPGDYRLCGYVEPFPGDGAKGRTLLIDREYEVVSADMPEALSLSQGDVTPGVFSAGPGDIEGAPAGTRLEIEVVKNDTGAGVRRIAATNVPTGACAGTDEPVRRDVLVKQPTKYPINETLNVAYTAGDTFVIGGAPNPDELHGVISEAPVGAACVGHYSFIARRVASGDHPLIDRLSR